MLVLAIAPLLTYASWLTSIVFCSANGLRPLMIAAAVFFPIGGHTVSESGLAGGERQVSVLVKHFFSRLASLIFVDGAKGINGGDQAVSLESQVLRHEQARVSRLTRSLPVQRP